MLTGNFDFYLSLRNYITAYEIIKYMLFLLMLCKRQIFLQNLDSFKLYFFFFLMW